MQGHHQYISIQQGEKEDRVLAYAGLVKRLAHHIKVKLPPHVETDDLIQAGMIGLLDAIDKFNASHGVSFESFATLRIRGAMLDQVRKEDWGPRHIPKKMREVSQVMLKIEHQLGRPATSNEIAHALEMSINDYHQLLHDAATTRLFNLNQYTNDEGDDDIEDQKAIEPFKKISDDHIKAQLIQAITLLPEREKLTITLYYLEELNLKEIGEVLSVSESRVCQLHGQALLRLKSQFSESHIERHKK